MVSWTHLSVTLHVNCLSSYSNRISIYTPKLCHRPCRPILVLEPQAPAHTSVLRHSVKSGTPNGLEKVSLIWFQFEWNLYYYRRLNINHATLFAIKVSDPVLSKLHYYNCPLPPTILATLYHDKHPYIISSSVNTSLTKPQAATGSCSL
jgi:hypothetical protein